MPEWHRKAENLVARSFLCVSLECLVVNSNEFMNAKRNMELRGDGLLDIFFRRMSSCYFFYAKISLNI